MQNINKPKIYQYLTQWHKDFKIWNAYFFKDKTIRVAALGYRVSENRTVVLKKIKQISLTVEKNHPQEWI